MLLGFLRVIVEEELYDKEFVARYTYGFPQLRERLQEYSLEKVGCYHRM